MILISTNIKRKGVHGSLRVTKNRKNILSMRTCLKRTKKEKKNQWIAVCCCLCPDTTLAYVCSSAPQRISQSDFINLVNS